MRVLLVVYDNDSYIHWPPLGLMYIAQVLRRAGHEVNIWSQDLHHYPDSELTRVARYYDVVGMSFCGGYYQHAKAISLGKAIREAYHNPFFIIGGHGPAPEPEYFMRVTGADAVVVGEGERVAQMAVDNLLPGVYKAGSLIPVDDLDFPAWDLFPMHYYRLMRMPHCKPTDFVFPVLSGRGCPFHCNFCYRMDEGFRPRSVESIVEEVKALQRDYGITYVAFGDELLMSSEERTAHISEAMGRLGVRWECQGRLNYATEPLLALMKRNGCVFVNYGIEAVDDDVLRNMRKALTVDQITRGVEATLAAGMSPGLNIIWGNIGDTVETLWKGVDFLLRYDDGAQLRTIRPVTPYPGSPLYYHAIETGLLAGVEDFYKRHVNSDLFTVNFMGMPNDEAHGHLRKANVALLNNYHMRAMNEATEGCRQLYSGDASFRGWRQS